MREPHSLKIFGNIVLLESLSIAIKSMWILPLHEVQGKVLATIEEAAPLYFIKGEAYLQVCIQ